MRGNLGTRLKELREVANLTRLQLAERMDVSEVTISRLEDGLGSAAENVAFLCSINSPQAINLASALALEWAIFPDTQFVASSMPYGSSDKKNGVNHRYPDPWSLN